MTDPIEPANLRFLRRLVTVLTATMIGGLLVIIALIVIRFSDRAPDLPDSIAPLGKTLHRLNGLLTAEQQNIEETLDNFRQVSENLRDLTDNARSYPSQVIFGAPPPATEPD